VALPPPYHIINCSFNVMVVGSAAAVFYWPTCSTVSLRSFVSGSFCSLPIQPPAEL